MQFKNTIHCYITYICKKPFGFIAVVFQNRSRYSKDFDSNYLKTRALNIHGSHGITFCCYLSNEIFF